MQVSVRIFFCKTTCAADGTNILLATNLLCLLIMLVCDKKLYHGCFIINKNNNS